MNNTKTIAMHWKCMCIKYCTCVYIFQLNIKVEQTVFSQPNRNNNFYNISLSELII